MNRIRFRFYSELNDFLPTERKKVSFDHSFHGRPAIKDLIEAVGVPHTEVEVILVNGEPVDFSYRAQDGDRISVYPVFESMDVTPLVRVRPQPLRETRFVLDTHLGRLAAYLRMLGLDTLYRNDYRDEELARLSGQEGRILLTRDRGLLMRSKVSRGYYVRETDPLQQLVEVVRRFDLAGQISAFQRCLNCNAALQYVDKEVIMDRLPAKVREYQDDFRLCPNCGQVFWKGSHYRRMLRLIEYAREQASKPASSTQVEHESES